MKRRIRVCLVSMILFLFAACFTAQAAIDFSSKPITLTLAANHNKAGDLGHAFLIIRNNGGGSVSFGDYQIPPGGQITIGHRGGYPWIEGFGGAYVNVESFQAGVYQKMSYASIELTAAEVDWIYRYYAEKSSYNVIVKNCTTTASYVWGRLAKKLTDQVLFDNVPASMKVQIDLIPGSKKGSLEDSGLLTSYAEAEDIFYIDQNGGMFPARIAEEAVYDVEADEDWNSIALDWTGADPVEHPYTHKEYGNGYILSWEGGGQKGAAFIDGLSASGYTIGSLEEDTQYTITITTVYHCNINGEETNIGGGEFVLHAKTKSPTIEITPEESTIGVKETKQLTAKVEGKSKKVTWKSSNSRIASVSKNGLVKGKKEGTVIISAKANGKKATAIVHVKEEYKKLYKAFLARRSSGSNKIPFYYLINIDRKGVPELVVCYNGGGMANYQVFTVRKHKVVSLGYYQARGVSFTSPTCTYSKKWKGMVASGWTNGIGGAWSVMYGISGKKLKMTRRVFSYIENNREVFEITPSNTRVSKAAYQKYYNKYFKGTKSYKPKKNTAANREKSFGKG